MMMKYLIAQKILMQLCLQQMQTLPQQPLILKLILIKEPTLQIVLEAMRNGCKQLLYASGSGVYGETGYEFVKEDFSPMEPISTYGASKLDEALICSYALFGIKASAFGLEMLWVKTNSWSCL